MKAPHPTDLRDAAYIRAATHFNAMVFLGVGRFDRVDGIVTLDEAKAVARSIEGRHPGKRAMIYAVTAEGRSAMVTAMTEALARL